MWVGSAQGLPAIHLQNKNVIKAVQEHRGGWETKTTAGCGLSPISELQQAKRGFSSSYSDNMQVPPFEVENVLLVLPSSSSAGQVPAPTLVAHLDELSAMKQPLAWG